MWCRKTIERAAQIAEENGDENTAFDIRELLVTKIKHVRDLRIGDTVNLWINSKCAGFTHPYRVDLIEADAIHLSCIDRERLKGNGGSMGGRPDYEWALPRYVLSRRKLGELMHEGRREPSGNDEAVSAALMGRG